MPNVSGNVSIANANSPIAVVPVYQVGGQWQTTSPNTAIAQQPLFLVGGDHPYLQWWGSDGTNGFAAFYLNRGIRPYLSINTDDPNGEAPGGSGRMTWAQIRSLQAAGVEMTNHGARHWQSWLRGTTGFTLLYTGTGTDASLSISAGKTLTTSCTGAAGDNVSYDLTLTANNTLAKVAALFNATGKYVCTVAPELSGSENSINLSSITGLGIKAPSAALTSLTATGWASGTSYNVGDVRKAVSGGDNGYLFVCTTAGTSGGAEPSWVKQIGATTSDNTATWTCRYAWATLNTGTVTPNQGTNVAASAGIAVLYNGTTRNTAYVSIASNLLTLYEDGVQVVQYDLTLAANDTLTELVALINGNTGWNAKLCDNTYYDSTSNFGASAGQGAANNNYCSGGEFSRDLKNCVTVDVTNKWVRLETGLPQFYTSDRNIQRCHDQALANGVTLSAFCQSGGDFFAWLSAGHQQYNAWRGDIFTRFSGHPNATIATQYNDSSGWASHKDIANTPQLTAAQLQSYMDALIDSGPFVWYSLCHSATADGSSGYTLTPTPSGTLATTETIWNTFITYTAAKLAAGSVQNCTPSQLPSQIIYRNPPRNYIFNPKFRNYGGTIASLTSDSSVVAGWLTRTGTTPTISIDANGICSITAIGSSQTPFSQDLLLIPGETYRFTMQVEFDATHAGNGVRIQLQTRKPTVSGASSGAKWTNIDPNLTGTALVSQYFNRSGLIDFTFTVPKRVDYSSAYVRSRNQEPFNLSVNTKIVVNYSNIGATADINCAGGTPASTTAKEVAAAINTAVAGTAAYLSKSEYHTAARAENGYVILQSPYRGNPGTTNWIKVTSGSATDALATIFGTGSSLICQGEPFLAGFESQQEQAILLIIDVNTTAGSVVQFQKPSLQPIRYY